MSRDPDSDSRWLRTAFDHRYPKLRAAMEEGRIDGSHKPDPARRELRCAHGHDCCGQAHSNGSWTVHDYERTAEGLLRWT